MTRAQECCDDEIDSAVDGLKVAIMRRVFMQQHNDQRLVQIDVAEFFTLRAERSFTHRLLFDSFDLIEQLLGRDLSDGFATSCGRDAKLRAPAPALPFRRFISPDH